jgi:CRP-like cAMP-binding protein
VPARIRHVETLERLHCLKTFPLFSELPPEQLTALAEVAREVFFRKRATVVAANAPLRVVHFIVEGRVRVTSEEVDGKSREVSLGPGSGVGLLEMLARVEHAPAAVAETETVTLAIDRDALLDVLEDEFAIWKNLLAAMAAPLIVEAARGGLDVPAPPEDEQPESARSSGREMDFAEMVLFLRRSLPFAEGSIVTLAELSRSSASARRATGDVVWRAGERADAFVMVVRGELSCAPEDGVAFRAGRHHPAGLLEALTGGVHWYTATAAAPTQTLTIPGSALLDCFEDNSDVAMAFMGSLAGRLLASDAWRRARPDAAVIAERASA